MKKAFVILLILFCALSTKASEIEDDYLDIASNYAIIGDYKNTSAYLDKILQINPNNSNALKLKDKISDINSKNRNYLDENLNPYIKDAMKYKHSGDTQKMINALQEGTKAPNGYLAYYYLGNYFRSINDYKNAIDFYKTSIAIKPNFSPAYLGLGITLNHARMFQSSINPLEKYLEIEQNDDLAYYIKAQSEFELGLFQQALNDINKSVTINNAPEYRLVKAKILTKTQNYQEAKKILHEILPNIQTSETYEYMGLCEYNLGNYSSALSNYERSIILSEDDKRLEAKYNEVKSILESRQNEKIQGNQE